MESGINYIMKKYISNESLDKINIFLAVSKKLNRTDLDDKAKFENINKNIDEYIAEEKKRK